MIRVDLPTDEAAIRRLKVGDEVELFGRVVTARDAAHKLMVERWPEWVRPLVEGGAIYHCGPVMRRERDRWTVVAAGPTTSIREEPYEAAVMARYGVRAIIGKGGMGPATLAACREVGAVYVHAVGGAASLLADAVEAVEGVRMLEELGVPEAFWSFRVAGFKGVVTMDSNGRSLHAEIEAASRRERDALLGI